MKLIVLLEPKDRHFYDIGAELIIKDPSLFQKRFVTALDKTGQDSPLLSKESLARAFRITYLGLNNQEYMAFQMKNGEAWNDIQIHTDIRKYEAPETIGVQIT